VTRFRFFEPNDEVETGQHLRALQAIDELWQRFSRVSQQRAATWLPSLRTFVQAELPDLGLEVRDLANSRALYVLALGGSEFAPLAEKCLQRAPRIAGWEFRASREPCAAEQSLAFISTDYQRDLSRARAKVGVGRGHGLEIVIASETFVGLDREQDLDVASELVLRLLGDSVFDTWISHISTLQAPKPSPLKLLGADSQRLPLSITELSPSVNAGLRGIEAELPDEPCHRNCERADWVMFECSPDDGALARRAPDLLMACTMRPEMLKWYLQGGEFSSARFSRQAERFCYLKLTEREGTLAERAEKRVTLEEQIDRWLVPGAMGCVVGGGSGTEYQYIYLALTQLEAAIAVLRRHLPVQLSEPAWLLFCDSEWSREWLALGDRTLPAPL
jgi:hypothetical protein